MLDQANAQFSLLVNGDLGPEYTVFASTNLVGWTPLFTTNPPALPFTWSDPNSPTMQRFYRVLVGP